MQPLTIDALAEKVEAMVRESEARRRTARLWKRAGLLAILGVVAMVAGGAFQEAGPRTVEAERFLVKGKDGRVHAELGLVSQPGSPVEFAQLTLRDQKGKVRVEIGVGLDGSPSFGLRDADERTRLTIAPLPDGSTQMHFYEKAGWGQLSIGAWPDGSGVKLYGPDGKGGGGADHGGLIIAKDGSTKLNFFTPGPIRGPQGAERVSLGITAQGKTSMKLTGGEDQPPLILAP